MDIHIFIAHMGVGGAERVCVNLANEFAKNNKVHIIVLNLENDVNTQLLDERVEVHELGVSRLRYAAIPMLKYIRKNRPKFIFVFGNEMAVVLNKLNKLKLTKVPIVVRVLNNVNISLDKEENISPIVEKYLKSAQKQMKNMSYVIAQCEEMRKMIVEKRLVDKSKIRVIYNPVSNILIDKVDKLKESNINSFSEKYVTFVGRVDPQKQPEHLIKAFALVIKEKPELKLRIVGDGILMGQIKELVNKMEISDSVIFDGIRKDMENVYANASVVVLTSRYEGMPNSLIEAIGCGIPVVSYDCPIGPSEIIQEGINGYLVEQDNIQQFADKIIDVIENGLEVKKIKESCHKFDVTYICKKYYEIFETLN